MLTFILDDKLSSGVQKSSVDEMDLDFMCRGRVEEFLAQFTSAHHFCRLFPSLTYDDQFKTVVRTTPSMVAVFDHVPVSRLEVDRPQEVIEGQVDLLTFIGPNQPGTVQ